MPLAEVVAEIVPHAGEHAVTPCVSVHVTPLLAGSTVAVNSCATFSGRRAPAGVSAIAAGRVTVAEADAAVLATEVAVIVTVKSAAGGVVGAV